ncbi:motility associated factor glycosyltransferase family protein [Heyndrickxia sporothermodurans]
MFYEKNKRLFEKIFPKLIKGIDSYKGDIAFQKYHLIETKQGLPSLKIEQNEKMILLHSKYDPYKEAETIIKKYEDEIEKKEHIIFLGGGLEYHIEKLIELHPSKTFTIIEPNPFVFLKFLESRDLKKFPFKNIRFLYIPNEKISIQQFLQNVSNEMKGDSYVFILPVYERYFKEDMNYFLEEYKEALKLTKSNVGAQRVFAKRWIINSLMNFPTTLTTPNLIQDKKDNFKGKPIIIVSAGPSLYEDINNLKEVKEKGLAYIFAVGSANKALINNDVIPDAVVTYDPQPHNHKVFKELIESGRTDIPMIYGTSVGFETIEQYQGPKLHVITSADPVSNYYLGEEINNIDVYDSFTVALIALQIAIKVEAKPIIFSGQNLAFKNNRYYAQGVAHEDWNGEVREEEELESAMTTVDVYGNVIETNESLNNMKVSFEQFIEQITGVEIINTTKGGAAIKGVPFIPIEELLKERLNKDIVHNEWYKLDRKIDSSEIIKKVKRMERSIKRVYSSFQNCLSILAKLDNIKNTSQVNKINRLFVEFDKEFDKLIRTDFYQTYLKSILSSDFDFLDKEIQKIYNVKDQVKKIDLIKSIYTKYLYKFKNIFEELNVHVQTVLHRSLYNEYEPQWKTYKHNDGCFHYKGKWENHDIAFKDLARDPEYKRKLLKRISNNCSIAGGQILFNFEGTKLRIIASVDSQSAGQLKIFIDEKIMSFSTKDYKISNDLKGNLQQVVFEASGLENKKHQVKIELLTNELFSFEGIQINPEGRAFHIFEVMDINDLELGKLIRCHYNSNINRIGDFSGVGCETSSFIPTGSTAYPNGDFYLVMVDSKDKKKILVADRVIQNYISWDTLNEFGLCNQKGCKVVLDKSAEHHIMMRLIKGDCINNPNSSEWEKYLAGITRNSYDIWNFNSGVSSLVFERKIDNLSENNNVVYRGKHKDSLDPKMNELKESYINYVDSSIYNEYIGFRPLVIID